MKQSRSVGVPVVQLTMHVKSSILYGRTVILLYGRTVVRSHGHTVVWLYGHTSKFCRLDGLPLFCIIMVLRSVSSTKTVLIIISHKRLRYTTVSTTTLIILD